MRVGTKYSRTCIEGTAACNKTEKRQSQKTVLDLALCCSSSVPLNDANCPQTWWMYWTKMFLFFSPLKILAVLRKTTYIRREIHRLITRNRFRLWQPVKHTYLFWLGGKKVENCTHRLLLHSYTLPPAGSPSWRLNLAARHSIASITTRIAWYE